ncbi:MAG: outer membrane lipoprotein-sorting protein [Candidatus Omnitrophota bacterium]
MRRRILYTLCAAAALVAAPAARAEMTADEIVKKANSAAYYEGKDGKANAKMVITDSQGRTRERLVTILKLNLSDGGEQKYYVYFHKPSDVKNMVYLVWKHIGKDDDRWLYLPALDLVRRIAASDKRSSFAGTNFLYEDISGRNPDEDTHELMSAEGGRYELKNTPKNPGAVEFASYTVSIDRTNFIPMKADYYDKSGKLYRTVEALEVGEIEGHPTIIKMKASDLNSNASTVTEFIDVKYDVGLNDDIFTERYLRRAPAQWIEQ